MVVILSLATPLVALAASLAVILAIRFLDVVEREPKRLIAFGLGLGALSTIPAIIWQISSAAVWLSLGLSETLVDNITTVVDAPISEELFKGLALFVLIVTQRQKLHSLTDFLVYACAVGIGFELVENVLYQWSTFSQDSPITAWVDEFNNRTLATAGSHAFFSIWLGLGGWILFQAQCTQRIAWALGCLLVSIILHSLNNGAAVMTQAGPPDVLLPINRLGTTLSITSNHLDLALFIGLVGVAVLRDIRFLIEYAALIHTRLIRGTDTVPADYLLILQCLTNPINHVMASSAWSWKWCRTTTSCVKQRSAYRTFAELALTTAQRGGPSDPSEVLLRSSAIEKGVMLITSLA